jgi:indole-3-glycerol phosphate synthase
MLSWDPGVRNHDETIGSMQEQTFLQRILDHKREEVERQQAKVPLDRLRQQAETAPPARPFGSVLRHADRLGLIAEIKKQSPSKGLLARDFDPLRLARVYTENGADAISVLTDLRFFGGSLQHLKSIRATQLDVTDRSSPPLLRKDFLVDPYQVWEARAYGADAVLIIVAALDATTVHTLLQTTRAAGMEALVEVHTTDELRIALDAGADLIGINNRNLHTFEVDVHVTDRVLAALPSGSRPIMISLSGLSDTDGLKRLRGLGADAILVGEAIVTAADPAAKVRELRGAQGPGGV